MKEDNTKKYSIDSSFPCIWEDITPKDLTLPSFTISSNEPENSCEEEHYEEGVYRHWYNINITDKELTKEHAIRLIKEHANLDVEIEELNLMINV